MYTHYIVTRILGIWIRYILYAYGFLYWYVVRIFEGGSTHPLYHLLFVYTHSVFPSSPNTSLPVHE